MRKITVSVSNVIVIYHQKFDIDMNFATFQR